MGPIKRKESTARTWFLIFLLLLVILIKGFLSYFVVGDQGQPDWNFEAIKDVPGESSYANYPLDNPQHVKGGAGEMGVPERQ